MTRGIPCDVGYHDARDTVRARDALAALQYSIECAAALRRFESGVPGTHERKQSSSQEASVAKTVRERLRTKATG